MPKGIIGSDEDRIAKKRKEIEKLQSQIENIKSGKSRAELIQVTRAKHNRERYELFQSLLNSERITLDEAKVLGYNPKIAKKYLH